MKIFLLLVLVLFSTGAHSKIYRCIDIDGKTIFKDSECLDEENLVKIVTYPKLKTYAEPNYKLHFHNLVKNPAFDKDLVEWTVPEYTWWEKKVGRSGSGAAIIQAVKPAKNKYIYETSLEQCVTLQGNGDYGLSADLKLAGLPDKTSGVRLNLYWYKSLDCKTWGSFATYLEPKRQGGWQHLSRKNLTPTMGAVAALIKLTQNGRDSGSGKAIWDNVQFFPLKKSYAPVKTAKTDDLPHLASRVNLIQNSGFSASVQGWYVSSGNSNQAVWSMGAGIGALKATIKSSDKSLGTHVASQCVALGQQRNYTLGARFLRDTQSNQKGGGRLRLTWFAEGDCHGAASPIWRHADPEDRGGWQSLVVEKLVAPAQARSARVELIQSVRGAGKFIGYWDDVVLIPEA